MTSLIHPIHSISQKCRPKHQVLVLKCYPKYQKNVQEAKPSPSELSYLLYYASSRRSKLQKVGAFLEKKVGTDVWMGRLSNVQVSLQIVTALIEKTPRDLMLYSGSVLNILDSVLRSRDINMVEESLPTFEAFCRNVDAANLGADKQRAKRYLVVLNLYAGFVDKNPQEKHRVGESVPVAVRWRTAGLRGIKAAVTSNALTVDVDQQLNLVMPIILDNMSLEQGYLLAAMQRRARASERQDEELAKRRRMSTATVATVDTIEDHLLTASETTADADAAAEDEVRALALRCLKQIFSVGIASARGQTRLATAHVLKFIAAKNPPCTPVDATPTDNWATSLFEAITRWTPVHDRYLIVLTAVEALVKSPVVEAMLDKQLVLATLIDWLLSSDINLIGLSVMDVLIGIIYHTLLLLQLGGRESGRQSDILGIYREAKETFDPASVLGQPDRVRSLDAKETTASPVRQALLQRLQNCVAALSNHIYYTDQITDMITAILARLKPTTTSDISTTAQAINNPTATTNAIAEAACLHDDSSTDSFFSFATARSTALKTVKGILVRVNSGRTAAGVSTEARSRVSVHAWDGTQWLLKDSNAEVRLAYIDALLTWLRLETNQTDLLVPQVGGGFRRSKSSKKIPSAAPVASRQDAKPAQSFLQLLHLAAYDAALERAGSESDVLLLHLLLSMLVEKLGVNALRNGLPMILKLQHDALNTSTGVNSAGKVHVAGLVHGYLWTVADRFGFMTSNTGKAILGEISRRKQLMIWFDKIKVPASSVETICRITVPSEKSAIYPADAIDALRPFLDVYDLVDEIADAYDKGLQAPASAASSPGRVFSVPTLSLGSGSDTAPGSKPDPEGQLPKNVKDEMTSTWSRDACVASAEESPNSVAGLEADFRQGQPNHSESLGVPKLKKAKSTASQLLDSMDTVSTAGTPSREATVKVTELKRALSGFVGAGISGTAWRSRPLPHTGARTPGAESTTSWDEIDEQAASSTPVAPTVAAVKHTTTQPEPVATAAPTAAAAPRVARAALTTADFAADRPQASPLRTEDVPSESRTTSSLHLPGTYPQDGVVNNADAGASPPVAENLGRVTSSGSTQRENDITDADAAKPAVAQYHRAATADNPPRDVGDAPAVSESGSKPAMSESGSKPAMSESGSKPTMSNGSVAKPATAAGGVVVDREGAGAGAAARGRPWDGGTDKIDVESLLAGIRPRASAPWAVPVDAVGGGVPRTIKVGVTAPPY
ncbi:hypothetical protein DV736_g3950, partial [Chaetothyriales sp. CBS 134916]